MLGVMAGEGAAFAQEDDRNRVMSSAAPTLAEVLESTEEHHPQVRAALASLEAAEGQAQAADGGFDPVLSAYGRVQRGAYYEYNRVDVQVRQATPLWGTEVYAGYRYGRAQDPQSDRFPSYYGYQTGSGGELRAGVRVPLWRNGPLDSRRAGVRRGELGVDRAEQQAQYTSQRLARQATDAHIAWGVARRQEALRQRLLNLAETRAAWLQSRIAEGLAAEVDALDAERAVLRRRGSLISATRSRRRAGLYLSLFWRDANGRPQVPAADSEPASEAPPAVGAPAPVEAVLACHPSLEAKRAYVASLEVREDLARAQRGPRLDASFQVSRDMGEHIESNLEGTVLEAGLSFSMPLLLRTARGRLDAAEATLEAARESLRYEEESLQVSMLQLQADGEAAVQSYEQAQALRVNAERQAEAEDRRLQEGISSLFMINQREQALAEATLGELRALQRLWQVHAARQAMEACLRD